ncbi:MAG: hypothetical protein EI684_21440 [Candidatus Viridilinea halotolerans]|uniref:Uncharacterized protein n=1 Tax=Candidatus Viridilinea halotolerans TaxID=2491704 RepID=A0A426TRE0_9CHLR|nr:MAG: hypothetical protein EI684_21440 [Candidatus Viridilinea halotolerans]
MPHSLPNGTRAIIQIGAVQILATPVAEASAVQQVLLAHDALADWRVFSSPLLAYAVAVHHPTPPPPPPDMVERAFNGGVRVRAVARQREANPTMTVTISAPGHPLWIIHTSARHVGEVDRMLRRLGVRFASIIGPQLWLALGLPPITRQP